ncbi:unnamed protein product [Spirodela intermedia]|uniref:LOB domain-containing protein n=1 Tax=Spirodela intermedia TaxID=51605 RepID=A0A7I8JWI2_SPIIN|nr:unnamed protein product [Spirodela intermedia]
MAKEGPSQACAACKFQRRKCGANCLLAPYFPPDQPKLFENAHRLFGVSNILKTLSVIDPSLRSDAMRSILYESDLRARFPVEGCAGAIRQVANQVYSALEELASLNEQIRQVENVSFPAGDSDCDGDGDGGGAAISQLMKEIAAFAQNMYDGQLYLGPQQPSENR